MLEPSDNYQKVLVGWDEFDQLVSESPNPYFREAAQEFKGKFRESDELHEFCTNRQTWDALCGRAGYIITRNGEMVAELVTMLN